MSVWRWDTAIDEAGQKKEDEMKFFVYLAEKFDF